MNDKAKVTTEEVIEAQQPIEEGQEVREEKGVVVKDEAEALISQAIDKNVSVDIMERLLVIRRELKAEKAKEAYDGSMAAFQADCPVINKTKEVKTSGGQVAYKYAPIESIVAQVKDALKKHGFSYSTNMELLENGVKVSVKVTHAAGHSEVTEMTVPLGTKTNIMSQSQVVAAAQTFAKRYAFCNAFGILTGDEDIDGATETLTPRQMAQEKEKAQTYARPTTPASKVTTQPYRPPVQDVANSQINQQQELVPDPYKDWSEAKLRVEVSKLMNKGKIEKNYQLLSKASREELIEVLEKAK